MEYVFGLVVFLFGAAVGSFILVIADRYNTGFSFLKGRSYCFSCSAELKANDLIPIFSYILLKGRCRHCGSKIPYLAFSVEIIMGILSLIAAFKSGLLNFDFSVNHPSFIIQNNFSFLLATSYLLLLSIYAVILLISIYDLRHFIIPDRFLIFLLAFVFLHNSYFTIHNSFLFSLFSGFAVAFPFLLIFLVSRGRWIGLGDIKYMAVLGFWLGLAVGISAIVLAFWLGAAYSALALAAKKFSSQKNLPAFVNNFTIKSEIPFGPFISLGAILNFIINADLFKIKTFFGFFA